MNIIRVLVTAIGGPTALGILKCLSNIKGLEIMGADAQRFTPGNKYCVKNYVVPRLSDYENYVKNIKQIVDQEKIDIIFPTMQDEIAIYHEYQKFLGCHVAVPESAFYDALLNKRELYRLLKEKEHEDLLPEYYLFEKNSELREILNQKFKNAEVVCVKNIKGHGGIGVALLTKRENYIKLLSNGHKGYLVAEDYLAANIASERMVMEFLDGEEVSVDLFMHRGKVVSAVSRKRNRVSTGVVIDGIVEKNEEVIEKAKIVAENVATDGFLNIQFINSKKGYKLTDLNARFCGSQIMSYGAGVNFPEMLIQYKLHGSYTAPEPIWGTRMIRYWDCCFNYD